MSGHSLSLLHLGQRLSPVPSEPSISLRFARIQGGIFTTCHRTFTCITFARTSTSNSHTTGSCVEYRKSGEDYVDHRLADANMLQTGGY
jgi:hypothetical protein